MATMSARQLDALLHDWRGATPAYSALADRIRLLILDGRMPVGARLPAERDLAVRLGVSRTTVSATYSSLRERGFLDSVRGSGSVARLPGRPATPTDPPATGLLDFSKAALPAVSQLAAAAERAAAELPSFLSGTGFEPVGIPRLRQAIADRYTVRGVPTRPEQIMVTVGAQHAIALLARVLLERGDRALVESPSYPHAFQALREAGGRLVPASVTIDDGWDLDGIEQTLQRSSPTLGYVMPDFHNPTGRVMPAGDRERLLTLASRSGTVMISDETMAELSIDEVDQPLPFAAYGPAVSIGSVGKTVWGGLRIGWIRAEPALIEKLVRSRLAIDLGTPVLEQLIVADLLGRFDEILVERRELLRSGRDRVERMLRRELPQWRVPHVTGGLCTWVALDAPVSSQLTLAARMEGLSLAAGPLFGLDGAFERFIRIPFGYSEEETDRAVTALAAAWSTVSRTPVAASDLLAEVV